MPLDSQNKPIAKGFCIAIQNLQQHWRAVWYWLGWTTVTHCCYMQLQLAVFRSYSACRTMQPGLFSRHQDDHTHCHCYVSCTGCRFITELTTIVGYNDVQDPQYQHTSVDTSSCVSLHGRYARPMYHWLPILSCFLMLCTICVELSTYFDHSMELTANVQI